MNICEKCDCAIMSEETICIACEQHEFKKGGNNGSVSYHPGKVPYLAVTAVKSKWFKTYRGAFNFMEREGYNREK